MRRTVYRSAVRSLLGERPLGRWCLPISSPHCDQLRKGELADLDNGYVDKASHAAARRKGGPMPSRDPISVLLADMFGM